MIEKIKEYKNNEELNLEQIKALKEYIKEMEKNKKIKNINELNINGNINDKELIQEYNKIKALYENEINKNKDLMSKIHYKDEQIEGLKIVINKFADEREKMIFKETKKDSFNNLNNKSNNRYNNYDKDDEISNDINLNNNNDLINKLKEAQLTIDKLKEKNKKLEKENKNMRDNNKLLISEYKSEGGVDITGGDYDDEEYNIKRMINETKKRNQSEDLKIDYPGLSNIKQKYDELEEKFRNLEAVDKFSK